MRIRRGQLLFSPSDLTEFMESEFASWMSRLRLEHPSRVPPKEEGASGAIKGIDEILQEHGEAHERAAPREYLARTDQAHRAACALTEWIFWRCDGEALSPKCHETPWIQANNSPRDRHTSSSAPHCK